MVCKKELDEINSGFFMFFSFFITVRMVELNLYLKNDNFILPNLKFLGALTIVIICFFFEKYTADIFLW